MRSSDESAEGGDTLTFYVGGSHVKLTADRIVRELEDIARLSDDQVLDAWQTPMLRGSSYPRFWLAGMASTNPMRAFLLTRASMIYARVKARERADEKRAKAT